MYEKAPTKYYENEILLESMANHSLYSHIHLKMNCKKITIVRVRIYCEKRVYMSFSTVGVCHNT